VVPSGAYVYALLRSRDAVDLGPIGVPYGGVPGHVRAIRAGVAAALVSPCETRHPVAPLRRTLEPHHNVIQTALALTTVVPMAFGHVARSESRVAVMLERQERDIEEELDRLEDKVEMGLRVRWEVPDVFKYIVDGDAELAALRDRAFAGRRRPTPTEKIELGRLFDARREDRRERLAERLVAALSPLAVEVNTGRPRGEQAVADLSFLIERRFVERFGDTVRALGEAWPSEYVFQCTGPWAPFHFVELELEGAEETVGEPA
jgi:hypothetical protein